MRPKLGDRILYKRGSITTLKGTVIAVSETGVHYLVKKDGGVLRRIGLSRVVKILGADEE